MEQPSSSAGRTLLKFIKVCLSIFGNDLALRKFLWRQGEVGLWLAQVKYTVFGMELLRIHYAQLLGLETPWQVKSVTLNIENNQVDIHDRLSLTIWMLPKV